MAEKGSVEPKLRRVPVPAVKPGEMLLDTPLAHYLQSVLRLRVGAQVTVFDGTGLEATASLIATQPATLKVAQPQRVLEPAPMVTVALAIPKGGRSDWAIEKLSELGVSHIIWVQCERSVVQTKPQANKQARWTRLATAASRQSGRSQVPTITGPVSFDSVLGLQYQQRWIAAPEGDRPAFAEPPPDSAVILVGPEGGFTSQELAAAQQAGYNPVRLGSRTLRIETAAIVGAAWLLAS